MLRDILLLKCHEARCIHVRRLIRKMGIEAIYRKANTSQRTWAHRIFVHLMRDLTIERSNHVLARCKTYNPIRRGFVYLSVVPGWGTRKALTWRLSNHLMVNSLVDEMDETILKYGASEIMNPDHGSQFIGSDFIGLVRQHGIQVNMNSIFVERLETSVNDEATNMQGCETVSETKQALTHNSTFTTAAERIPSSKEMRPTWFTSSSRRLRGRHNRQRIELKSRNYRPTARCHLSTPTCHVLARPPGQCGAAVSTAVRFS